MHFGPRLEAVAALVPPCRTLADIGTDHAYLPVLLLQEGRRMQQAYALRAPRTRGIPWKISGSLLGLLFLRSLDRARTVYESMELRGFQGRFPETGAESSVCASLLLVILTLVWCLVCRNLG